VNYTAMAPGLGTDTGTVTLSPSAFVLSGPFGLGADFFTTSGAPKADLTVFSARLSSALNFAELQEVRGDLSVTVGISSSLPSVGTITVPQLVFAGGTSSAQTQFDPVSIGTTLLSIAQPAGFSAPSQHGSLAATVRLPQINVNDRIAVGQNLQASGILLLGQPAPTGGAPVRLESNSSLLLLSTSPTSAGTSAITINIPAGQSSAVYYLHALGNAGNAGYTVSAPGYTPRSVVAALSPSGVVISGPLGFGIPLVTTIAGGAQPVTVSTALLDASTNAVIQTQALAAGRTVNVPLSNTAPAVGTIPTQATITGGTDHVDVLFTPRAVGATVLGVNQPAGFTLPANNTTMTARVN
jgi:hypothetical protein